MELMIETRIQQLDIFELKINKIKNMNKLSNLSITSLSNSTRNASSDSHCRICLDKIETSSIFNLSICGHIFCKECLKTQILNDINSQPLAHLPIKCISCNEYILNSDIFSLFTKKDFVHINYQLTKYFMTYNERRKDYSWC